MIPYSRDPQQSIPTTSVKIVGLGGAGANMLERVALDGMEGAELLALNTDIRTLSACVAGEKIQLGRNLTKGLGTGGDPELGHQAILEAEDEVRAALKGRRIVFLCTGLGGGTGSGAAPIVARIAREEGAFVVVFATMPFAFEGRRRREQADTTLNELAVLSNALVTFDNNRMGELVLAKQGIHEAFSAADRMICESIKAVIRCVVRPGLINVGLDELMSALRTTRSRCLFGSGIANGKDRAAKDLRNALASPLLDQGSLLSNAQTVLVHLSGGEDLTLFEIELLMQKLLKFIPEKAHVLFGAAIDPGMGESLSVTLISALPEDSLATAPRETLTAAKREMLDPADGFTPFEVRASEPAVAPAPAPDFAAEPAPEPVAQAQPANPAPPAISPLARNRRPAAEPEVAPALFADPDRPFAEPESPARAKATPPAEPAAARLEPEMEPTTPTKPASPPAAEAEAANDADPLVKAIPPGSGFTLPPRRRPPEKPSWGKLESAFPEDPEPITSPTVAPPREPVPQPAPEPAAETPKLKLGVKTATPQSELSFDSTPRGRFEGADPSVVDGEDLDLPPFLRKKR